MIEYKTFKKSEISDHEWDSFVENSDNGTLFHKREFLAYHPKDRFNDASFVVKKDNKVLALFTAAVVEREGKYGHF